MAIGGLNCLCVAAAPLQNELAERIPEFHRAAAGDLQMAMQMYQAEVGSSLQTIEQEVRAVNPTVTCFDS